MVDEFIFSHPFDDFLLLKPFLLEKHNDSFLLLAKKWTRYQYDNVIHSDNEMDYYCYQEDENILSQPTISIYVPLNGACKQAITLSFDNHSYTETTYAPLIRKCIDKGWSTSNEQKPPAFIVLNSRFFSPKYRRLIVVRINNIFN